MSSNPEFPPVPLRIKLAALWAALMSCYIYGDYFELFQPGQLTKMISGHTDIGLVSQDVLLVFAILLSLPALMIFSAWSFPVLSADGSVSCSRYSRFCSIPLLCKAVGISTST